jgi:hypothetical protein
MADFIPPQPATTLEADGSRLLRRELRSVPAQTASAALRVVADVCCYNPPQPPIFTTNQQQTQLTNMRNIEAEYQEATAAQSDRAEELKLAVQIVAGLLASGHFTEINADGDPTATRYHIGDEWGIHAVDEAVCLLKRLKKELAE